MIFVFLGQIAILGELPSNGCTMKKYTWAFLIIFSAFLLFLLAYTFFRFQDRHPDYHLNISYKNFDEKEILVGFSKVDITPLNFDTWTDQNQNARYEPKAGDSFHDLNKNGKFDPIWLAGFHQNRPASGVNDPLWARTMVIENGEFRLAFCVIDMISFGNDEVISLRKRILEEMGIDYLIVSSTHVHSSPDLMGMYGPSAYKRGVNPEYLEFVNEGILKSVELATKESRPAKFKAFKEEEKAKPLVGDTRDPQIFDAELRILQVLDKENGLTLGTLLNWGNHPETLWSNNTLISSDFPHYFRKYVEEGIVWKDSLYLNGLGGIAIFANGALGGLMTTHPSIGIMHPYSGEIFEEANDQKIDAQGMALAKIVLEMIQVDDGISFGNAGLQVEARTVELPLDNSLFWLGAWTGIFDRGFIKWGHIRSELAAWQLGPVSFVHFPGELYPEILNGGIEAPDGADFGIAPVEVPAIRSQMPGTIKFFNGMSNDMIGYIIPKSQWDEKAPFTYGLPDRPYGEINSLGPETAPILHKNILEILNNFTSNKP